MLPEFTNTDNANQTVLLYQNNPSRHCLLSLHIFWTQKSDIEVWTMVKPYYCIAKSYFSNLGFRPVWSESLLCAQWVAKDPSFLHADSEDSDQSGRMPRLIWVFAGRTYHFVGFVVRRLISVESDIVNFYFLTVTFYWSFKWWKTIEIHHKKSATHYLEVSDETRFANTKFQVNDSIQLCLGLFLGSEVEKKKYYQCFYFNLQNNWIGGKKKKDQVTKRKSQVFWLITNIFFFFFILTGMHIGGKKKKTKTIFFFFFLKMARIQVGGILKPRYSKKKKALRLMQARYEGKHSWHWKVDEKGKEQEPVQSNFTFCPSCCCVVV